MPNAETSNSERAQTGSDDGLSICGATIWANAV
jgi:hypothetical protein